MFQRLYLRTYSSSRRNEMEKEKYDGDLLRGYEIYDPESVVKSMIGGGMDYTGI